MRKCLLVAFAAAVVLGLSMIAGAKAGSVTSTSETVGRPSVELASPPVSPNETKKRPVSNRPRDYSSRHAPKQRGMSFDRDWETWAWHLFERFF
jgi:hypothetical protein